MKSDVDFKRIIITERYVFHKLNQRDAVKNENKLLVIKKDGKKYIDGEEILCEYIPKVNHVKYLIIFLATMIFFFYIRSKNFNIEILMWLFFVLFIVLLLMETYKIIKTIKVKKVFFTKNHIIDSECRKIKLSDISLRKITYFDFFTGVFCWRELNFYKNNKFLFYTLIADDKSDFCILKTFAKYTQDPGLISKLKSCSKTYIIQLTPNGRRSHGKHG